MVLITAKCPSSEMKITSRNSVKICAITGDEPPEAGSTAVAIARPEDDAIFSPANDAAAKNIDKTNPADTPIMISVMPTTTPSKEVIIAMLGNSGFKETTIMVRHTLIKILTGKITNFAPNKGEASKNEPILKLAKKNCATNSRTFCSSNPGRAPIP